MNTNWTSRERMLAIFDHKEADRVPMTESFWGTTLARWKTEGLPDDTSPHAYFGLDEGNTTAIDWSCRFPEEVIEETDSYTIKRNKHGALQRTFKNSPSMNEWSDFTLKDWASWEEEIKPRMAWDESRVDLERAKANYETTRDTKVQTYFPACCGFEAYKYLMGTEELLVTIAADPDWTREMFMATADQAIDGLEYLIGQGFVFDVGFITEDLGFSNGPFCSPQAYRELIMPCQKRFVDACHANGMKAMLHTCGDNRELLPSLVEAGFDILNPLEVKAGMDVLQIKKDYGEVLTLWGGIDVRPLADPEADFDAMARQIEEKVTVAKQGGGYVFSSDHSIPDNISFASYRKMLDMAKEYGRYA